MTRRSLVHQKQIGVRLAPDAFAFTSLQLQNPLPLNEHGHDDVNVVVHAYGADGAGARGGSDFEGDLRLVKDR